MRQEFQDVCLAATIHQRAFRGGSAVEWLLKVARTVCGRHVHRRARLPLEMVDDDAWLDERAALVASAAPIESDIVRAQWYETHRTP